MVASFPPPVKNPPHLDPDARADDLLDELLAAQWGRDLSRVRRLTAAIASRGYRLDPVAGVGLRIVRRRRS